MKIARKKRKKKKKKGNNSTSTTKETYYDDDAIASIAEINLVHISNADIIKELNESKGNMEDATTKLMILSNMREQHEDEKLAAKMMKTTINEPSFIIAKPNGQVRFLTDFREVNKRIVREPFSLQKIAETHQQMEGFTYASAVDMNMGYYHLTRRT
jgi:hypothetical protein